MIKQLAMQLPGEEALLEEALGSLEIPQVLLTGLKRSLQEPGVLDRVVDIPAVAAMLRESQRGSFWLVPGASSIALPGTGSRPGTIMASDAFNSVFAGIQEDIENEVAVRGLVWEPPDVQPCLATPEDLAHPHSSVSFVDDLTAGLAVPHARDLIPAMLELAECTFRACLIRGLRPNADKTKVLLCFRGPQSMTMRAECFGTDPPRLVSADLGFSLEVVRQQKCLGAMIQDNGSIAAELHL
eukprot:9474852-Pyramimonas_sp.AAC.1